MAGTREYQRKYLTATPRKGRHPRGQTVQLGGKYILSSQLAKDNNIDPTYLSRVFSGARRPSIDFCKRIAPQLGMSIEELLSAIEARKRELARAA